MNVSRRQFLKTMGVAAAGITVAGCTGPLGSRQPGTSAQADPTGMTMRSFGSTGASVSLFGLGGQAAVDDSNSTLAIDIINRAIDLGVNYIDTAFSYGSGRSESHIGQVMATRRNEVFLATKSNKKSYDGVMSEFDDSLSRLQTDYVDLYQVHNIGTSSDVDALYAKSGGLCAIDAFARLRDEGRARFIGITGHHDPSQLHAVLTHPDAPRFDSILLALNPADHHQRPFFGSPLWTEITSRNMAIIAMKVTGMTHLLPEIPNVQDCLNYVYSFPISCAIVGVDSIAQLEQNVEYTNQFPGPLPPEDLQALESMTTPTTSTSGRKGDWFKVERY